MCSSDLKGHCVNRLMIDSGYAWVDREASFSRREEFERAEDRAKALRVGYWQWNKPKTMSEAARPAQAPGPAEGEGGEGEGGSGEGGAGEGS